MQPKFWGDMKAMSRKEDSGRVRVARRSLLQMTGALASGLLLDSRRVHAEEAAPPGDNSWSQSLGAGVVDRPYGKPADGEAGVIRRNVPWLTAGTQSSISFSPLQDLHGIITPNGLFFERYHAGRPDVDADKHRLMIHGLVDRPLVLTMKDILRFPPRPGFISSNVPPMAGWNGVRAAEFAAVYARHDQLRRMDRG